MSGRARCLGVPLSHTGVVFSVLYAQIIDIFSLGFVLDRLGTVL